MTSMIRYRIEPVDPAAHVFEVRLTIPQPSPDGQVFSMPAWIPGSYMIRDYARNVVAIRAESDGLDVELTKLDKSRWRAGVVSRPLTLVARIFAYDLSVRGAHLDTTHAYFNGPCVFFSVEGQEDAACELEILPPDESVATGWRVATSMRRKGAEAYGFGTYEASDYAELIDHPVEIGHLSIGEFEVNGIPHGIAIRGHVRVDMGRLCHDLQTLCEQHISLLGVPNDMDRYLFLLAILIMILNWVNTTGEYILAELVVRHAEAMRVADAGVVKADIIAAFYGNFFFVVNMMTLLMQVFLVARIIRWIGIKGAVLVLPVIVLLGYGLVVFIPIFSIIRIVKIMENSTDYSLMNTTRHALYLPLSSAKKFEGKTAIEAFFWRFGDLLQAGAIYAGLNWFHFDIKHFAALNMILAVVWFWVAWQISGYYRNKRQLVSSNMPPRLYHRLEDRMVPSGVPFRFQIPDNTFIDPDEGDVMVISAHQANDDTLPAWLDFDSEVLGFSGTPPVDVQAETRIILRATDFDGAWAEGELVLRHSVE